MNNLTTLFSEWTSEKNPSIIHLLNKDRMPIAAIYPDRLNLEQVTICETQTGISERYYLYLNGVAIFFTYYQKAEK